jgi:hypothetical protein
LFHSNLWMLNYDKTYFLQFLTKTNYEINFAALRISVYFLLVSDPLFIISCKTSLGFLPHFTSK